jgi:hypothetical protein
MAFFGLTDIKFNDIQRRTSGPLGALDSSPFINNALRYPIDVGTSVDKGHYMIFFVREQINTNFSAESRGGRYYTREQESGVFNSLGSQLRGDGLVSSGAKKDFASFLNDKKVQPS